MCGIAGVLAWDTPADLPTAERMVASLRHRGPDAAGVITLPHTVLGHRRLAVIDLSDSANQPMTDSSGRYWIVHNGEVYNFRELRRDLQQHGVNFRTQGDTEVILEAFKLWDIGCIPRLAGMFAFAIWDARREMLVLARDRAGEKPLYYMPYRGGVAFGSEVNTLRPYLKSPRSLNPRVLGQYLATNYVVGAEALTLAVKRIEPAHYVVFDRNGEAPSVGYWDLAACFRQKRRFDSVEDAANELSERLDSAVAAQLVADVPVGAFLSGGLDSSSVVAALCAMKPPRPAASFSMGFAENTYDERPYAAHVAATLGIQHHERLAAADMSASLAKIVCACDEPMADTSIIPMYFLAQFAREQVTVCLSGDGSDEIFGGYETYKADILFRRTRFLPRAVTRAARSILETFPVSFNKVGPQYKARQFLAATGLTPQRAHVSWREIFSAEERQRLVHPELHDSVLATDPYDRFARHFHDVSDCDYRDQSMYVDFKTWLPDDILVKVDRMTMAHGLESRAPFLDHRLVEFAASLPPGLKVRGGTTKYVLKRSQRHRLPKTVIVRSKQGFNAPVSHWFNGPLTDLGRAVTSAKVLGEWFDSKAIDRLWDEHRTRQRDNGFKLFGLTCLGLWLEQRA